MKPIECLKCKRISKDGGVTWVKKAFVTLAIEVDYDVCSFCKAEQDKQLARDMEFLNLSYILKMFWWR
ncbi:hypothetical protein LCGC14_0896830 [marine sediment metagenome]|uniref:Uncharacterized protein n=1 Tax=marine sediment metagenome TaxID=412755 RepID=A0A0F9S4E7_9ZZZZ